MCLVSSKSVKWITAVNAGSIASPTPLRRQDRPSLGNSVESARRFDLLWIESNPLTIENDGAISEIYGYPLFARQIQIRGALTRSRS
jgi:hypothetical protein